jgi:hypothetical protein
MSEKATPHMEAVKKENKDEAEREHLLSSELYSCIPILTLL